MLAAAVVVAAYVNTTIQAVKIVCRMMDSLGKTAGILKLTGLSSPPVVVQTLRRFWSTYRATDLT
jgi:hypothetical protein